jgi:hypothetical protein
VDARADAPTSGFSVQFTDCVETIGVGLVSTDLARALVPPEFILVGEGSPVTAIVVRTATCGGIAVAGHKPKPGIVVQIGVVIVPPDFTGDINNYTLWYYTSDAKLAEHLQSLRIDAQHVPNLESSTGNGEFHLTLRQPGSPLLSIDGLVWPAAPAGSFESNWWVKSSRGTVKLNTLVPDISIGPADLLLTTASNSALASLIGGTTLGFPIIQQFNPFPAAVMTVRLQ